MTFSRRYIQFLCRRTSRKLLGENWRGSCQLRSMTRFSLIWSLFQFLVTIDYILGQKHIESMLYASTQPEPAEGELLSNRFGTRTTQHIHVRSNNECWIIPYPHVVQKSVEFSGVGSFTHQIIINTYGCSGALFTIQNLACTWCLARLYNSRGRWTIAESKLWCVFKLVSIPCLVFYSQFW